MNYQEIWEKIGLPPAVAFVGPHNVGKTTFILEILKILRTEGYKPGVLKSTKEIANLDHPGKDTFQYRELVSQVGLVGPSGLYFFSGHRPSLEEILFRYYGGCDLVIIEGFKHHPHLPKIEIARRDISSQLLAEEIPGVIAVVADFPVKGWPLFSFKEPEKVVEFIKEKIIAPFGGQRHLSLWVNGRPAPLKYFIRQITADIVLGVVRNLRLPEKAKLIELRLDLED
ncbi:molybdopterin-guanine dinucleotide biosynthesis protein B [Thermosulfuriphilus sp.]